MDCAQCDVLRRVFEDLERIYFEARARFSGSSQCPDADKFNKAQQWLNEVRLDYEVARIELERHEHTHVTTK